MCALISGLFIGSNGGRPPQAYRENIVSLSSRLNFIKFSSVVIWIQHIENCVNPVLLLERQELRPINNIKKIIFFNVPFKRTKVLSA